MSHLSAPDAVIAAIARGQYGLVTRAQLLRAGLTTHQIVHRVRRGTLHQLFPGVYHVGHDRPSPHARWLAAVLAAGEGAVLSHQSAAALYEIGPLLLSPVHVTIPWHRNRRSRPGLHIHRSRTLEGHTTERAGIPVTTVERTLDDLPRELRDEATNAAIVKRLRPVDRPFHRSKLELRVRRRCRELGIPAPLSNEILAGRERDFVWPGLRLVLEVDGPHHRTPAQRAADARRDEEIEAIGYRALRADEDEIEHVLEHLTR